jgi:hypothetical protein
MLLRKEELASSINGGRRAARQIIDFSEAQLRISL